MPNLWKRIHKLRALLNVRVGTGAAILPSAATATKEFPAITRLHLTYARKIYGGHQGARHFWRNCFPRLKYHNPAVQMTVKQTADQEGPAALTIYFSENISNAASLSATTEIKDQHAPTPSATEKTAVMNLKDLTYTDIWQKVKLATGARDLVATPEEQAELQKIEQMRQNSEADRARVASIRQAKKDQELMLQQARGEVEKLKQL
ncbi:mitochondrial 54S ribosomal protein mL61 [Aspergillus lucknowensis]|uniref:CI-B8 domain-containing protein n=1 Tax=Aspergillus lucknowensis TaxID=176173 RepID=A0ABR4LM80_9EURO